MAEDFDPFKDAGAVSVEEPSAEFDPFRAGAIPAEEKAAPPKPKMDFGPTAVAEARARLGNVPKSAGQVESEIAAAQTVPLVSPEIATEAIRATPIGAAATQAAALTDILFPKAKATPLVQGVTEGAGELVSGMTTPGNISLAVGTAGIGEAGQIGLGGYFAAQAAKQLPTQWKQFNDTTDPKEKSKLLVEMAGEIGLPLSIFGHAAIRGAGRLTDTLFPKPEEVIPGAINERPLPESGIVEHPAIEEGRPTTETSGGNRPEQGGEIPQTIAAPEAPPALSEVQRPPEEPTVPAAAGTETNVPAEVPAAAAPVEASKDAGQAEPIGTLPEVIKEQSRLTTTKNEVVDAERKARGLAPIISEVTQSNPETMSMASNKLKENPAYGKVLVDDLVNGTKRDVSEVDEAVLLREKIATQNARRAAAERANDTNLSEAERAQARQEFDDLEIHSNAIDQATYRSGEVWGRLGQFRQRLAAEDYSLSSVEARLRVAKGGKPLTLEESQGIKEGTEKMGDLQAKIAARRERLEKSVAEEKGLTEPKVRRKNEQPVDTEIEALQTELQRLRSQERETERLPAAKERTAKRISDIEQRIKDYGFAKPTRPEPVKPDKQLLDLQYQYAKTKETLDRGIFIARRQNASLPQRIFQTGNEILSLPRAIKASMDLSAVRRQGGTIFMAHPIRALKNFGPMLKAAKSEQGFFEVMQGIRDRPNMPLYRQSKLALTEIDPTAGLSQMEEVYMSRWANAIPLVNHSQRAYVAFLNRLRADSFDAMANSLGRGGEITQQQANALSNFINVFTGRGALSGKYSDAASALNQVFFAPRYVVSRFQTIIGQPLWKGDAATRTLIAKEYARTLVGYGVMYGLIAYALPNAVEFDPRSSDFGKIKIGNTRIDPLSGLSQATVVTSRLTSGRTKNQEGEVRKIYGEVPYGKTTSVDVATRFLRSKLAPVPSSVVNYLQGQTFTGDPVTLTSSVSDLVLPLSGNDIYDAMKEQGVPGGAALGTLAIFGDGLQTYSQRVKSEGSSRNRKY